MSYESSGMFPAIELPDEVDMWVWRLMISKRINVTLQELEHFWTLEDMLDAHIVLDIIEVEESRAYAEAKAR